MRFDKFHFWAWIAIAASLFACSHMGKAETISYNEEQTAYNAAINIALQRGCTPSFKRTAPYHVIETPERITIVAKEVSQDCTAQADSHGALISWTNAGTRADGTTLPADKIASVEIYTAPADGSAMTKIASVPTNGASTGQAKFTDLKSGTYRYALTTVDTDGQESALSQIVSVTIP